MHRIVRCFCAGLCLAIAAFALSAHGEEVEISIDKLPKAVVDAVKAKFKEAKIESAIQEKTSDGKTMYEVSLKHGGHNIDVSLTAEGKITISERELDAKDLPQPVAKTLADKYAKATFKRVEELTEDGKTTYEILLDTADKKTLEVIVDAQGKIVSAEDVTPQAAASADEKVEIDQLPKKVADAVKARFPGATIIVVSKATENGVVLYDIEMKLNFRKH